MADIPARTARPRDVARLLGVDSGSVGRYARDGKIPYSTTPNGHRRYNLDEVRLALAVPETVSHGVPQTSSAAVLAFELEQIEADLAALNLRVQAFARMAHHYFRKQNRV